MTTNDQLRHALLDLTLLLQDLLQRPKPMTEEEWQRLTAVCVLTLARARGLIEHTEVGEGWAYAPGHDDDNEQLLARLRLRRASRHLPPLPTLPPRGPRL
jgi:hypothetical protein